MGGEYFLLCFDRPELAARIAAYGLPVAMFLVGLAGSLIHCLGMCGPFVLGQAAGRADRSGSEGFSELQRLRQAALLPYHLGRMTSYAGLGAAAGAIGTQIFALPHLRILSASLLILAALILIGQIIPRIALPRLPPGWVGGVIERIACSAARGLNPNDFFELWRFGLLLGFLPCGFLWGAVAAAAASGGALQGGLAMMGFALGTMPSLIGLAWGGSLLHRRYRHWLRWAALPLQGLNAIFLLWVSARVIDGL